MSTPTTEKLDQEALDAGNAVPAAFVNHVSISNIGGGGDTPLIRIVFAENYISSKRFPRYAMVMPYGVAMALFQLLGAMMPPAPESTDSLM